MLRFCLLSLLSLLAVNPTKALGGVRLLNIEVARSKREQESFRDLQQRGLIDLVDLIPFDVQIALTANVGIQPTEVTNLVTKWLNDSFEARLKSLGYTTTKGYAAFDSIFLLDRGTGNRRDLAGEDNEIQSINDIRQLQQQPTQNGVLFTGRYRGTAVFARNAQDFPNSIPTGDVLAIQSLALTNHSKLLSLLQLSKATGLGSSVVDVNAYLAPDSSSSSTTNNSTGASSGSKSKSTSSSSSSPTGVIIYVAIAVACVAVLFLVFAVLWAWFYDRRNREAYLVNAATTANGTSSLTNKKQPSPTGSITTSDEENRLNRGKSGITAKKVASTPNTAISGSPDSKKEEDPNYPSEIGVVDRDDNASYVGGYCYPESVISDDIESALSQYYRSGLADTGSSNNRNSDRNYASYNPYIQRNHMLNDAASVSSMESYGYSLDGFAPSLINPADAPPSLGGGAVRNAGVSALGERGCDASGLGADMYDDYDTEDEIMMKDKKP